MQRLNDNQGFTLIEMIVSLALFSTVITIAVGALLVLIASNEQLQEEQSIMTNLSFALDSMTREIRTGTFYYCDSAPNYASGGAANIFADGNDLDLPLAGLTQDCSSGNPNFNGNKLHGVTFVESGDSVTNNKQRIVYFYDDTDHKIYRRIGDNIALSIVSSGLYIKTANFFVTGSTPGDGVQPTVTIYIEAAASSDPNEKTYAMQTTVTQRELDI